MESGSTVKIPGTADQVQQPSTGKAMPCDAMMNMRKFSASKRVARSLALVACAALGMPAALAASPAPTPFSAVTGKEHNDRFDKNSIPLLASGQVLLWNGTGSVTDGYKP